MNGATVHLVDDDTEMLKALARLLRARGFQVRTHCSGREFLAGGPPEPPACVVLDLAMPEIDGLELQQRLARDGRTVPVVFLTGHGDIPGSVRAMKAGAVDFLTKPVDHAELLRAVTTALNLSVERHRDQAEVGELARRHESLTPREREVLTHLITGRLNKQIAADLGTSEQTVKVHRMRIAVKMGMASAVELARAAQRLGIPPASWYEGSMVSPPRPRSNAPVNRSPRNVAILDDEAGMRTALSRLLRARGFRVTPYASGVDLLTEDMTAFDCILLDLHMPGLSGFDVLAALQNRAPVPPVVVLTGHDDPDGRARVHGLGAAAYLTKPVDQSTLLTAIDRAVDVGGAGTRAH